MLPPGHLAGGYLAANVLLKLVHPVLPTDQIQQLLGWGIFFSFAPDLDNFVAFVKVRAWWYKPGTDSGIHRQFYSHVPLLWLLGGILVSILGQSVYWQMFGLMLVCGSWTHFFLDSIESGVMWLWPFSHRLIALKDAGVKKQIVGKNFLNYWLTFLKYYFTRWTFYLELLLIILVLFKFNF